MLSNVRKLIYEGTPLLAQSRNYANMVAATRMRNPEKTKPIEMETDSITKLKIMRDLDASGYDHRMLIDYESKDERGYYWVYGMFTTSPYEWCNKKPEFVADFTLLGAKKYQYFHRYEQPHIIHESNVRVDYLGTLTLHDKDAYDEFIKKIKKQIEDKT